MNKLKRLKKIIRWMKNGNNCDRCPALWVDQGLEDCDCGCYIKGEDYDEAVCRLPYLIRALLCRRNKYLAAHEWDGYGEFHKEYEAINNVVCEKVRGELNDVVLCRSSDATKEHELPKDVYDAYINYVARAAIEGYSSATFVPNKRLSKKWRELFHETAMVPVNFLKSYILS
jgi:hypothetical protein